MRIESTTFHHLDCHGWSLDSLDIPAATAEPCNIGVHMNSREALDGTPRAGVIISWMCSRSCFKVSTIRPTTPRAVRGLNLDCKVC